jgi:hypothetical protein
MASEMSDITVKCAVDSPAALNEQYKRGGHFPFPDDKSLKPRNVIFERDRAS